MSSSYRYNIFTLRAYLCWRHTYCQCPIIELAKNVSSKNKTATSHVVQIHMHAHFPQRKKWPTYHVAIPTGNALALQRSIFRESVIHLKFSTFIRYQKVSIICGTNNHMKSEMLSNRHRQTHRPSTVTLAVHARWGLIMVVNSLNLWMTLEFFNHVKL